MAYWVLMKMMADAVFHFHGQEAVTVKNVSVLIQGLVDQHKKQTIFLPVFTSLR